MKNVRFAALAAIGLLGLVANSGSASAMPLPGISAAIFSGDGLGGQIEAAAWVCGPYRCHHVHGGPRPYYAEPDWRDGGWRHHHHHPRYGYGWRRW